MIFTPIEGREDCQHYTGFVGVYMHNRQARGVMHCAWHEYLNAISGARGKLGGIPTDRCDRCPHYKPQKEDD